VPVPTARFAESRETIIQQLLDARQLLQARFGEA